MAFQGGPIFSEDTDRAMRLVSLILTPIFVGYNLLTIAGITTNDSYLGPVFGTVVSLAWVVLGTYVYFASAVSKKGTAFRLIMYHLVAIATLVGITGFLNPFAPAITLLFLASHLYFGWFAVSLSIASVVIASVVDMFLRAPAVPSIVSDNTLGMLSIVTLGSALVWIIATQETRRQALLRSQDRERLQYERTTTIINNLTDATFSTDQKGTVLMYNAACLDLLDTNDSLKGKSIGELFNLSLSDKKAIDLFDILKQATRASSRDDIVHTYKDGEQIRLELTFAPIKSTFSRHKKAQIQAGYILILRDVTKRKSLEEERDEFISVVSHELRTPITIVEGTLSNLDILLSRSEKPNQKTLAETVKTAHDQVLYLAKMVNDLSTLSRAERGVGDTQEMIDVRELLVAMHGRYEKEASEKKLHLNLDLGTKLGKIYASRLYTEELLQNFITNAIKYTKKGSVTIICRQKNGKVKFTVKDTGIGISRNEQAKVFDKFYRSEDYRIRETGGTGLGLYVSTKLSHKLKTKISLVSRLNHGSSFSFELPNAPDDLSMSPPPVDT